MDHHTMKLLRLYTAIHNECFCLFFVRFHTTACILINSGKMVEDIIGKIRLPKSPKFFSLCTKRKFWKPETNFFKLIA
jgi:hypothetical protein